MGVCKRVRRSAAELKRSHGAHVVGCFEGGAKREGRKIKIRIMFILTELKVAEKSVYSSSAFIFTKDRLKECDVFWE